MAHDHRTVTPAPHTPAWQPIETMPKAGCFLVYLPDEYRQLQVMYRNERGITVIGGAFGFDMGKPGLWMPLEAALSAARALLPAATDSLAIVPNSQAKTEVEG